MINLPCMSTFCMVCNNFGQFWSNLGDFWKIAFCGKISIFNTHTQFEHVLDILDRFGTVLDIVEKNLASFVK